MLDKVLTWDRETFIYLNSLGVEKYDAFWRIITTLSTWTPLFIFFIFLLFYKETTKKALTKLYWVLAVLLFVHGLTSLTKEWVARLRPSSDSTLSELIRIVQEASVGYSFFSGHASFSFSLSTIIVLFLKDRFWWVWLFYLWALLIVFSRIYVGVHYPIDLIMGALVGTVSAYIFYLLYCKFTKRGSA
tara:strand:- start:65709 stop:66272 length:564 start_codon:yes stop_codon:yes gene_type:complete